MLTAENLILFFEQHPDPGWVYDRETLQFLRVNKAAIAHFGYSETEFLELRLDDVQLQQEPEIAQRFAVHGATQTHVNPVWSHAKKSGETTYVEVHFTNVTDGGRPARLAMLRDVNAWIALEEKAAEASLRANEATSTTGSLERIAGRVAKLGAWRITLATGQVWWSEETSRIHELPPETTMTAEYGLSFYLEESQQRLAAAFETCVKSGEPYDELVRLQTAKGSLRWVRVIGEPEFDRNGIVVSVLGACLDFTEQVAKQEESGLLARRLHNMLATMQDGFFSVDRDLRLTFVNQTFLRMLGGTQEQYQGTYLWTAFPDARGTVFEERLEHIRRVGEPETYDGYFAPMRRWLSVNAYPNEDGIGIYFRDVSEQHAQFEQLRLLEAATSRINDILLVTEAEPLESPYGPKIVYVNDAFTRRTGYAKEEVIGKTPRILQGELTDTEELRRIRKALGKWEPVRSELINYTKAGEPFWLDLDIVPLAGEGGEYSHWVAVQRDITERKKNDQQLIDSENRFQILATATQDIVWDWDIEANSVWWNARGQEFFEESDALTPLSAAWARLLHPVDRERVIYNLKRFLEGENTFWNEEYRLCTDDGTVYTIIDRGNLTRSQSGKPLRMLNSMLDISERTDLAARLRQSQKLEALGKLTGGIAHDFNNLLTVILGNSEIIVESLSDDAHGDVRRFATMCVSAAERGAQMTERLLAFARKQPLEPQVIDVGNMLSSLDLLLRRSLGEDIELEMMATAGLWKAQADPAQLESALLNLALNARDAMPSGGRLTIETSNAVLDEDYTDLHSEVSPGQYVRLSISDTGTGMSEDVRQQIFEPFFTTKAAGKGSGLGLSMVFGFMKQSGGHINVYSELGEGTTVRLYIPRADIGSRVSFNGEGPKWGAKGGGEHILIVEDNDLVIQHVINVIESLGYRVSSARSGDEALTILKADDTIQLLFTDVIMPGGMNGRQLADIAQRTRPNLKVLFTSGYTENAIVHHGRLDADVELIAKPYRRNELAAKLRKIIEKNAYSNGDS